MRGSKISLLAQRQGKKKEKRNACIFRVSKLKHLHIQTAGHCGLVTLMALAQPSILDISKIKLRIKKQNE